MSPLTEGRGLKLFSRSVPHVRVTSPLTEGRGLKLHRLLISDNGMESPLTEGRGLKQAIEERMQREQASHLTKGCGNDV